LIVITGVPTDDIASIVAKHCAYATHEISSDQVVYFENACYVNGKYPVYYAFHAILNYTLAVSYTYNSGKIKRAQVEAALSAILATYMTTNKHVDQLSQYDLYNVLAASGPTSVAITGAITSVGGTPTSLITVPKTRIARLSGVTYSATDTAGA
jgi:hypothetical protein